MVKNETHPKIIVILNLTTSNLIKKSNLISFFIAVSMKYVALYYFFNNHNYIFEWLIIKIRIDIDPLF